MREENTCFAKELAELITLYEKGKNNLQEVQVYEQSGLIQGRQEVLATAKEEIE